MKATHEGWFWFCPCWVEMDSNGYVTYIPKYRLRVLYFLAMVWAAFCGSWTQMKIKRLEKPREV